MQSWHSRPPVRGPPWLGCTPGSCYPAEEGLPSLNLGITASSPVIVLICPAADRQSSQHLTVKGRATPPALRRMCAWAAGFRRSLSALLRVGRCVSEVPKKVFPGDAGTFPLDRCVNARNQLLLVLTPVVTGAQNLKRKPLQGRRSQSR